MDYRRAVEMGDRLGFRAENTSFGYKQFYDIKKTGSL